MMMDILNTELTNRGSLQAQEGMCFKMPQSVHHAMILSNENPNSSTVLHLFHKLWRQKNVLSLGSSTIYVIIHRIRFFIFNALFLVVSHFCTVVNICRDMSHDL